jgi:hypothetical protein
VRHLLLAVWILVFAGTASADWNEVMDALERATRGPRYDVGADPSEPGWVSSRKARLESERAISPTRPQIGSDPTRNPRSGEIADKQPQ